MLSQFQQRTVLWRIQLTLWGTRWRISVTMVTTSRTPVTQRLSSAWTSPPSPCGQTSSPSVCEPSEPSVEVSLFKYYGNTFLFYVQFINITLPVCMINQIQDCDIICCLSFMFRNSDIVWFWGKPVRIPTRFWKQFWLVDWKTKRNTVHTETTYW